MMALSFGRVLGTYEVLPLAPKQFRVFAYGLVKLSNLKWQPGGPPLLQDVLTPVTATVTLNMASDS